MTPNLAIVENTAEIVSAPAFLDPKATEEFLMSQPGIIDASAWFSEGRLHASVTLGESSTWTVQSVKAACYESLGIQNTPNEVLMFAAKYRAA